MLAGIAAVTSRVEFGPLVACTNFHNPALLAKQASTIDEISGGRFILGLGAGWNETEFRAFGFPYDHRVDRFEEAFTIIRTLLHEGAIDFDGQFYQARDCELLPPRGPRPGGPPLLIGSNGPRMLRMTMPYADAWNSWFADIGNRPDGVARLRDIVDEACRDVGRDPSDVERTVAVLVRLPGGTGRLQGDYAAAEATGARGWAGGDRRRPASVRGRGDRPCPARARPDHPRVHPGGRSGASGARSRLTGECRMGQSSGMQSANCVLAFDWPCEIRIVRLGGDAEGSRSWSSPVRWQRRAGETRRPRHPAPRHRSRPRHPVRHRSTCPSRPPWMRSSARSTRPGSRSRRATPARGARVANPSGASMRRITTGRSS